MSQCIFLVVVIISSISRFLIEQCTLMILDENLNRLVSLSDCITYIAKVQYSHMNIESSFGISSFFSDNISYYALHYASFELIYT